MRLLGKKHLEKLKKKNRGNNLLSNEVNRLIDDIEQNKWRNQSELKQTRNDADCVHGDGFYFFNIAVRRTLILVEFDSDGEATVVWAGNHQEYDNIFKNNKNSIRKWLKSNGWI